MAVLSLDKVSRRFGGVFAVQDFSMTAPAGPHHRADRPERRRQDHGRQSHYRPVEARRRQHHA